MATRTRKSGTAKTKKVDAYKVVSDRILEALEQGIVPWHRPWRTVTNTPLSLSTLKPYTGINVFTLGATSMARGYTSRWWGTYKQISERGGQVRRGETGTPVTFFRIYGEERNEATGKITKRGVPVLRIFTVFNAEQADDLTVPELDAEPLAELEPVEEAERVSMDFRASGGPEVKHGGNDAYYHPVLDYVQLPLMGQFESAERYYAAMFHEFGHSTGHEKRLARKEAGTQHRFGTADYGREELIAEMTAAFVCGETGLEPNIPQAASYIDGWTKAIKDDPKMLATAGRKAQKAADLILGRNAPVEEAAAA